MPNYLFTRLNYEVPFDGAEYINESDVSRVIEPTVSPQPGYVNWLFQNGDSSLTSIDGGYTLTPSSVFTPSYTENSVILPALPSAATYNGLSAPFKDSATQTMSAVIKYTGAASQIFLGCISDTVGEAITASASGVISYLYRDASGSAVSNSIPAPAMAPGDFIFIAFSRSGSSVTAMIGGASSVLSLSNAAKSTATPYNVGPGNTAFNVAGFSKSLEVMEFLYSGGDASAGDLQVLYNNAKLRCMARGKNIL
ncbi:TPA: hypothetical protein PFA69_002111 [Serratia marcescens]|nr:hypothetical protein [Serratia marcescens]